MEAVTDPSVREVIVMCCTQMMKTELLLNTLAYHAHQDPCPILLIQPTKEMADAFSKERLAPMIRDTPALTGLFSDPKTRQSNNTLCKKLFPGGYVQLHGANSPAGLAMRAVRILLLDEVDRYPVSAGAEGDPVKIAAKRQKTFWNRKLIAVSSPTNKGASRIESLMEASDWRKPIVPCPHCRAEQILTWDQVENKEQPEDAHIACQICAKPWSEADRLAAIRWHRWEPTQKASMPGRVGFWASELYSSWVSPAEMARDYKDAQISNDTLKTFVNTSLAETFEIPGDALDPIGLYTRREHYEHPIPNGSVLTFGGDVQLDRIEGEFVAWGEGEESWSIGYLRLYGDPTRPEIWDALAEILREPRFRGDGEPMNVRLACLDSGAFTEEVYRFCRRAPRRFIPSKGASMPGKPIVTFPRTPNEHRVYLANIGTDTAKELLFGRLNILDPGPGYCHFPITEDHDMEFFNQLCAEKRIRHLRHGHQYFVWEKVRKRNEALDCRILAHAALRILIRHSHVQLATLEP